MKLLHRATVGILGLTLGAGCADPEAAAGPGGRAPRLARDGGAGPIVTGSAHIIRDIGNGPEMTTFTYHAVGHADGDVSGHFQYNLRIGDVTLSGRVTCATTRGSQVWVGGVIDKVKSDDPADHLFENTEVWWRSIDNGEGADSPPDVSTGVLLTLPGTTITAASWCRDQREVVLMRPLSAGNITLH